MRSLSQNGLLVANLLPNRRGAASVFQGWTERMEAWCIPGRKKSNHTLYGSRGTLNQPIEVIQRWQGRPLGSFPAAMFECLYRAQPAGQFTPRFAGSTPRAPRRARIHFRSLLAGIERHWAGNWPLGCIELRH